MKKVNLSIAFICIAFIAACSTTAPNTNTSAVNRPANESKTPAAPPATSLADSPSAVVKQIYDHAIKRNCAAIPPLLTEEFRKSAGTSKESLEALCDSITDSGKITAAEAADGAITGDSAKVKVIMTLKDGKKEDREENMKKVNGKWLMDS
jgi:Domain of unknown function (DUF4878)